MNRKFEAILAVQQFADSGGTFDRITVAVFEPDCSEALKVVSLYRYNKDGRVNCQLCEADSQHRFDDSKCAHAALVRTFLRQKCPMDRIYYVKYDDTIGYWKKGKMVDLSKVKRVNR